MPHRLFIVISDRLRGPRYLSLADTDIDVLVIPEGLFSVEKEPADNTLPDEAWRITLKETVATRIRRHSEWKQSTVRIAAHFRTCFGAMHEQTWRRDRRFPEHEAELCEALGHSIDVQIWGFHHEPALSDIWTVVRQVKNIWKDPDLESKVQFLADLEEAFQRAQQVFANASRSDKKRETWETLSLAKHEIVGLFDPLRIRLETAREVRDEKPLRAGEIETEVKKSIDSKLPKARKLLNECRASVSGEQALEWFRRAGEQLNVEFDLARFPEWLNQLDTYLHNLRNSVTE